MPIHVIQLENGLCENIVIVKENEDGGEICYLCIVYITLLYRINKVFKVNFLLYGNTFHPVHLMKI
jgi:hypothetical protein